eukprot:Clim_evm46s33 gene=Clim_evmTU46s33
MSRNSSDTSTPPDSAMGSLEKDLNMGEVPQTPKSGPKLSISSFGSYGVEPKPKAKSMSAQATKRYSSVSSWKGGSRLFKRKKDSKRVAEEEKEQVNTPGAFVDRMYSRRSHVWYRKIISLQLIIPLVFTIPFAALVFYNVNMFITFANDRGADLEGILVGPSLALMIQSFRQMIYGAMDSLGSVQKGIMYGTVLLNVPGLEAEFPDADPVLLSLEEVLNFMVLVESSDNVGGLTVAKVPETGDNTEGALRLLPLPTGSNCPNSTQFYNEYSGCSSVFVRDKVAAVEDLDSGDYSIYSFTNCTNVGPECRAINVPDESENNPGETAANTETSNVVILPIAEELAFTTKDAACGGQINGTDTPIADEERTTNCPAVVTLPPVTASEFCPNVMGGLVQPTIQSYDTESGEPNYVLWQSLTSRNFSFQMSCLRDEIVTSLQFSPTEVSRLTYFIVIRKNGPTTFETNPVGLSDGCLLAATSYLPYTHSDGTCVQATNATGPVNEEVDFYNANKDTNVDLVAPSDERQTSARIIETVSQDLVNNFGGSWANIDNSTELQAQVIGQVTYIYRIYRLSEDDLEWIAIAALDFDVRDFNKAVGIDLLPIILPAVGLAVAMLVIVITALNFMLRGLKYDTEALSFMTRGGGPKGKTLPQDRHSKYFMKMVHFASNRTVESYELRNVIVKTERMLANFGAYVPAGLAHKLLNLDPYDEDEAPVKDEKEDLRTRRGSIAAGMAKALTKKEKSVAVMRSFAPKLGFDERLITVTFSDIANFTTISEALTPLQLGELMDLYLGEMSNVLLDHGGNIDKFIGDAIACFWNAPSDQPNHVAQAMVSALESQKRLHYVTEELRQRGYPEEILPVVARCGVHTDYCFVGNFGSSHRYNYTAIGDGPEIAEELEGASKAFGTVLLISEDTYERMPKGMFVCRRIHWMTKKKRTLLFYELMDYRSEVPDETIVWIYRYHKAWDKMFMDGNEEGAHDMQDLLTERPSDPVIPALIDLFWEAIRTGFSPRPSSPRISSSGSFSPRLSAIHAHRPSSLSIVSAPLREVNGEGR